MANAKKGQVSAKTIEAAIARGQGKSISGAPLENVTIEAMLPHRVAAIHRVPNGTEGQGPSGRQNHYSQEGRQRHTYNFLV